MGQDREAHVASHAVVEDALRTAASRATVDRQAAAGEQVSFERDSRERVVRLFRETGAEDRVIRSWNVILREFITAAAEAGKGSPDALRHLDGALALFALRDRLRGGPRPRYRIGTGGEIQIVGREDVDPLNDPWLAERNG